MSINTDLINLVKHIANIPKSSEETCYAMGYDCGINGATEVNCHFSLFSSKANTRAWETGKKQAELVDKGGK